MEFHIAYDRDAAGDKSAVDLAAKLADAGITSYRVLLPHGQDINEYACSSEQPKVLLGSVEKNHFSHCNAAAKCKNA